MSQSVILIASGDSRPLANQKSWPVQEQVEASIISAVRREGREVRRGHSYDPAKGHGFIDSQKYGMEVFKEIPEEAPLIVAESIWQYSHHVFPGLYSHRGPILTLANWHGAWSGLVGMLNLNACLTKAGVKYSTLWSEDFTDSVFVRGLSRWLQGQPVEHDLSHVHPLAGSKLPKQAEELGSHLAGELRRNKAIIGIFDEGCMGMYNAIIPDELLHRTGIFKERLSQSALYAEILRTGNEEARAVYDWLVQRGMKFCLGSNPETALTLGQIIEQCKMYIAAARLADDFGCDAIGIQYQQGLKDLTPASDLVEGLLNNVDRPPVRAREDQRIICEGRALPHFNEADECAGLDALATNRVWTALGFDPETTLHDIRYGEPLRLNGQEEFVWVFMISGATPPAHFIGGYSGAVSVRQSAIFFRLGGGTLKGVCKPGEIVWSRVFVDDGILKADLGRAKVVRLPQEETERRWQMTSPEWPIMHAVLYGVSRDQLMARHKSNHIQVAYAPDAGAANLALAAKAVMFREMGLEVSICGSQNGLV
jgi:hypothetical protein